MGKSNQSNSVPGILAGHRDLINGLLDINGENAAANEVRDSDISSLLGSQNKCIFGVTRTGALALVATTFAAVAFDTEEYDPDGCFNFTNSRFIAPLSGYYQFHGNIYASSITPTRLIPGLYVNGIQAKLGADVGASIQGAHVSSILKLDQGDYVQLEYFSSTAGGNLSGGTGTYLNGHMLASY